MSTLVRPSEYVDVPEHLRDRIWLFKIEPEVYEEARYQVVLSRPRVTIGYVTKRRTESWRKSGRIRTSLIGRPVHWEAHRTADWREAGTNTMDYSVGYHYTRRNAAAVALAEAFLEGVKP